MKLINAGVSAIGILLTVNAIIVGISSNYNLGILATFLIGFFLAVHSFLFRLIQKRFGQRAAEVAQYFSLAGFLFFFGVVGFIAAQAINHKSAFNEDAVIVLGAGLSGDRISLTLKARLDQALKYRQQNPDALIIVTGGQGPQESVTEASAMKNYLLESGIPEAAVLLEDKSTSTAENLRFAKEILDTEFSGDYKVAVITNDFHTYRALVTAKQAGLNAVGFAAPSEWYMLPVYYTREFLAVLHVWAFGTVMSL